MEKTILVVTENENDALLKAINVIKNRGLKEARLTIDNKGEAWIIRQTAQLVSGKNEPSGSSNA